MRDKTIIDNDTPFPIQPNDIRSDVHYYEAFGKQETEISARLFVRAAQKKGGWYPLTKEELNAEEPRPTAKYRFNGLSDLNYIFKDENGNYLPTIDFINRCYKAAAQC